MVAFRLLLLLEVIHGASGFTLGQRLQRQRALHATLTEDYADVKKDDVAPLSTTTAPAPSIDSSSSFKKPFDIQTFIDKAAREDRLFRTDTSVHFWRDFASKGRQENFRLITTFFTQTLPSTSPLQRAVWTTFLARAGFFGANAVAGNLLAERRGASSMFGEMDISFRILELIKCYEQELKYIENGVIKYPWDYIVQKPTDTQPFRIQWGHRQTNPFFALDESLRLIREAPAIWERRTQFQGKPSGNVPAPPYADNITYPRYYLNDFHYQTDGWLSAESAKRYEMSSETIFFGSQDVMQRQTLLPLVSQARTAPTHQCIDRNGPASILEVACGTGRFSTFVRDQFPAANLTLTDLSPYYLDKASENDRYWREYRGREAMKESTGILKSPAPARIVQANAESLPFPDDSFDAVLCVYLFHELPLPARRKAAQEMARVVKPGGMVVLTDSIQIGDRIAFGNVLDNFTKFNEPHYVSYQRDDLAALFTERGLECDEKHVNSRTKTLSFIKPKR
ncbi:hypothetical protein MPSEU_000845400 [Mayamaea pseudoterrestris]|nr:hypothetical protein MPSEU_000845400 [Mayamaea pseudoterrestris]